MPDKNQPRNPSHPTRAAPQRGPSRRSVAPGRGNILTLQLADFGAEVIKIEPPEGDTLRCWKVKGVETAWKVYSRNKKSVALDLRSDAGRTIVRELTKSAAILVESFRPGVLEDMGLAPAELHAINPKLIVVRISGWGQDGRYRHKPGFGTLIEGYSGFASMNGFGDREPVLPPMYLADCMAALNGYGAVMVALREVEMNGGQGQVMDLPLFDPLYSMLGPQAANYKLTGEVKVRTGSRSTNARRATSTRPRMAAGSACPPRHRAWPSGCWSRSAGRAGQGPALRDQHRAGEERPRARSHDRRVRRRPRSRREPEVFRRGRRHHRPVYDISQITQDDYVLEREALIEIPTRRWASCRRIRWCRACPDARRAEVRRAEDRRAQRGAAEAAARRGRIRQAAPGRRDQVMRPTPPVWRSILYVPGNVPKFIDKAHERGADCVLVDLEDSVQPAQKPEARAHAGRDHEKVARAAPTSRCASTGRCGWPSPTSRRRCGRACRRCSSPRPRACSTCGCSTRCVTELEKERGLPIGGIGFAAMIEHPRALAHINDIAEHGPRVIAMMLGGEDFALETGSVPGDETLELPKRLVAFAAQAHGVNMIGILGTVADYSDPDAYQQERRAGARFGFSGGTCIHPGLVTALNEAFTPKAEEVAYAAS
jgi:crotonobetainyl-CoA:carnitine CoA-transferase CaiB-like acyl-CoA transferase/citrate lyase beta subunit